MPKGNVDNLLKKDDLTAEQRRENARKAGKASAEKRKRNASIREIVSMMRLYPMIKTVTI